MIEKQSPYLAHPFRLADIVAALQVMGTYKFASRKSQDWEKSIGRNPVSTHSWHQVFAEHPEFFCIREEWISLIWRRSSEKLFDTHLGKELTKEEVDAMSDEERRKISRAPLTADQVTALIEVAIKFQEQAISRRVELRWWVAPLFAAIGLAVGALIKSHC
jgi:hypothetical protein